MKKVILIFIIMFISLNACSKQDSINKSEINIIQYTNSTIQNNKIILFYDLLKEVLPNHNNITDNRINIIFDCRNIAQENFNKCTKNLKFYLKNEFIENKQFYDSDGKLNTPGILQIEPYKSSQDNFNFWYIDRNLLDKATSENTMKLCDVRDDSIIYNNHIQNIILIYLCRDSKIGNGHTTSTPIIIPKEDTQEKYYQSTLLKRLNNVKAVVTLGFDETDIFRSTLIKIFIHETGGHAIGGLIDEYITISTKSKENKDEFLPLQNNGFPNCASTVEIADKWWKETGLINPGIKYIKACSNNESFIISPENIMISGHVNQDFNKVFSNVQKYWICRNIYNMTNKATGLCKEYKDKFGFDKLLYTPIE